MEVETLLLAAVQSSFLLGLLHGVNPCGHSWLVLAPFVSGEKRGARVFLLTAMFLGGTAVACLLLGASLGAVSQVIPPSMGVWVEAVTSAILIVIGLLLVYDPRILHSHEHHHEDHHEHHHGHGHSGSGHCNHHHSPGHSHGIMGRIKQLLRNEKFLPPALFAIGFVNMIIPCPTAAVMYSYALNAGSILTATIVFGTYALSTALAVGIVIYLIFRATKMATKLQRDWVEPLIMRFAGFIIIVFSGYGMYQIVA